MLHLILLKCTLIDTVLHLDLVTSRDDTLSLLLHFSILLLHLRLGFIRFILVFHCVNQFWGALIVETFLISKLVQQIYLTLILLVFKVTLFLSYCIYFLFVVQNVVMLTRYCRRVNIQLLGQHFFEIVDILSICTHGCCLTCCIVIHERGICGSHLWLLATSSSVGSLEGLVDRELEYSDDTINFLCHFKEALAKLRNFRFKTQISFFRNKFLRNELKCLWVKLLL